MHAIKLTTVMILLSLLAACGKGGTASSGSTGSPVSAKSCIELDRDESGGDSYSTFINECDYDINVAEIDGGSNEPHFLVKAGSRTTIKEYVLAWGACQAPFFPVEKKPFYYECENP